MIDAIVAVGLALASAETGQAPGSPAPLWRGVSRVVLVCGEGIDAALCDAAFAAARARTALPLDRADGAAATDRGTIILTIAVDQREEGRELVATARRAVEIDEAEAPSRQATAWPATSPAHAVDALLARMLPRSPRSGGRLD